jgi:hypothetical protein
MELHAVKGVGKGYWLANAFWPVNMVVVVVKVGVDACWCVDIVVVVVEAGVDACWDNVVATSYSATSPFCFMICFAELRCIIGTVVRLEIFDALCHWLPLVRWSEVPEIQHPFKDLRHHWPLARIVVEELLLTEDK